MPLSSVPAAFLQALGLQSTSPPPVMGFEAVILQALKMACSWFNSTRKSCGGLYGFFFVMVSFHLLVDSA